MTPQQRQELHEALLSAFRDYSDLEIMVAFGLGWNLQEVVASGPLSAVAFGLINEAEAQGAAPALVAAARSARPNNPLIVQFVTKYPELADSPASPPDPSPAGTASAPVSRAGLVALLARLPVTDDAQGRGALLQGIPGAQGFNRNQGNKQLDLTQIVNQVADLGTLGSGAAPLVILIDNALPFAGEGTQAYAELTAMRQSLNSASPGG